LESEARLSPKDANTDNSAICREMFRERYGADPEVVASSPGRVNLIGEHTDYNGGQVLPLAIERRTYVALRRVTGRSRVTSREERGSPVEFDMRMTAKSGTWSDYVVGVCNAFMNGGARLPQLDLAVMSDVPAGSGLSSSAALEMASALALSSLVGDGHTLKDLALLSWRVENQFVGVSSGVMDQFASALGEDGAALHLWCDTLETESVPLKETVLIFDTALPRSLRTSQYNQRRAECDEALAVLRKQQPSLPNLAAASPDDVRAAGLPDVLERRALHVSEETRRVERVVEALRKDGKVPGEILYESHESLRDNYECSTKELDWFVEKARTIRGVTGARLTGAGWGGCAIAVGDYSALEQASQSLCADFRSAFGRDPKTWLTHAAQGARLESR
jgi:galactokinase